MRFPIMKSTVSDSSATFISLITHYDDLNANLPLMLYLTCKLSQTSIILSSLTAFLSSASTFTLFMSFSMLSRSMKDRATEAQSAMMSKTPRPAFTRFMMYCPCLCLRLMKPDTVRSIAPQLVINIIIGASRKLLETMVNWWILSASGYLQFQPNFIFWVIPWGVLNSCIVQENCHDMIWYSILLNSRKCICNDGCKDGEKVFFKLKIRKYPILNAANEMTVMTIMMMEMMSVVMSKVIIITCLYWSLSSTSYNFALPVAGGLLDFLPLCEFGGIMPNTLVITFLHFRVLGIEQIWERRRLNSLKTKQNRYWLLLSMIVLWY